MRLSRQIGKAKGGTPRLNRFNYLSTVIGAHDETTGLCITLHSPSKSLLSIRCHIVCLVKNHYLEMNLTYGFHPRKSLHPLSNNINSSFIAGVQLHRMLSVGFTIKVPC